MAKRIRDCPKKPRGLLEQPKSQGLAEEEWTSTPLSNRSRGGPLRPPSEGVIPFQGVAKKSGRMPNQRPNAKPRMAKVAGSRSSGETPPKQACRTRENARARTEKNVMPIHYEHNFIK